MYEMSDISSADAGADQYKRRQPPLDLGGEPPTETSYSIRTPVRYVFVHKGGTEIERSLGA